jgi:hypothetical protein
MIPIRSAIAMSPPLLALRTSPTPNPAGSASPCRSHVDGRARNQRSVSRQLAQ